MSTTTIYLLPNLLSATRTTEYFPEAMKEILSSLKGVICESSKGAQSLFSLYDVKLPLLYQYNEHSSQSDLEFVFDGIRKTPGNWAVVSDCGMPSLADPGEHIVRKATRLGIKVEVVPGESSITTALLLSGFNAEKYCFHGYTPQVPDERVAFFNALSSSSLSKYTHIFIETPYRNKGFLESAKASALSDKTWFVCYDIRGDNFATVKGSIEKVIEFAKVKEKCPAVFMCK